MFHTITTQLPTPVEDELPGSRIRRTNACNYCREKKIRCNGEKPCSNCQDHGSKCVMLKRRRGRLKTSDPRSTSLSARLQRIEETLSLSSLNRAAAVHVESHWVNVGKGPRDEENVEEQEDQTETFTGNSDETRYGELENCSIYSAEASNFDYQGPRTMLSIFSPPAINWVCGVLKGESFKRPALVCIAEITRRLKVDRPLAAQRSSELPRNVIWDYVNAYFTSAYNVEFGVVQQKWFEARLKSDLNSRGSPVQESQDLDTAWYALKNAVFAVGCRIEVGRKSNFQEACRASWELFGNALSMHTQLLYEKTSLVGVQALIVMAYYTEAVGSPTVQYMLCSSAVRLAFSKALHKQPPLAWNIPPEEVCHRNWMFWAIYCLEKQICMRSGRPSLLEDDEIDVDVPDHECSGIAGSLQYCTIAIKIARLSSRVWKKLSSARALRQSLEQTLQAVSELNQDLAVLESDHDLVLGSSTQLDRSVWSDANAAKQAIALRFMFHALTFDLHTRLTYPWCSGVSTLQNDPSRQVQMMRSRMSVHHSCINTILLSRHIGIDASTPVLIGIAVPLHAAANLFIEILQHPESPTVQSDLALLDILAGFFARVDYETDWSECSQFVRHIAWLARLHVEVLSVPTSSVGVLGQLATEITHPTPESMPEWNNMHVDHMLYEAPSVHDLDEWRSFLELGDDFELGLWPA